MAQRREAISEAERTGIDFRAVAKVAQRVQLADVRLTWSQVGRFAEFEQISADWPERAFGSFDSHAALASAEDGGGSLVAQCFFTLHFFAGLDSRQISEPPEASEESPPALALEAVFELIYELDDASGIEESDVENFAIANATHNAWPYWREFAQSATLRLRVPTYIAPPFKLPSADDPKPAEVEPSGETEAGEGAA
jgi:hypothetical protein